MVPRSSTPEIRSGSAGRWELAAGLPPPSGQDKRPRRYLVVANRTACSEQLAAKIRRSLRAGPCHFHLVVPASADPRPLTWTEGEVLQAARTRLDLAFSAFRALGADVSGEVGDWSPLLAIEDALLTREFDEISVSTLPSGSSRWIRLDLAHRVAHRFGLPVSRVISSIDEQPERDVRSEQDPIGDRVANGQPRGASVSHR